MRDATGSDEAADQQLVLEQGTGMLETFLSLMPDAAVAVNRDGVIVAVNVRTESFFGYPANELEGKPIEVLVPERFRHAHRRDRAVYSSDPHARPMGAGLDLYARRRDGTEFPVDISLAPIGDKDDALVVAAVRDITERKAAQSAQAQLAAIVRSSTDAIFSMTPRGVMTSWNQAAEEMFGYSHTDVIGHHFSEFFPDDRALEELLGAARSGHPSDLRTSRDTRWLTHDGVPVDVAISVSHLDMRRRCRLFGPSPRHQGTQGSRGAVAAPSPLADRGGGDTAELAVRGFAHHLTGADMQVGLGFVERPSRCFGGRRGRRPQPGRHGRRRRRLGPPGLDSWARWTTWPATRLPAWGTG